VSCPNEATYMIWLDGELPANERRPVEAHLVQCTTCRALVLALRDEAELLGDVLLDRAPPVVSQREPAAPARGLALGFVPAAAAVTLLLTISGWIFENLPTGMQWMNPFQLKGATEMFFKVVLVIRDEVPGLLGLAVAVAATAGVSAVLTFAVTAAFRRVAGPGAIALAGLALLATPSPSQAHFGMHEHDDYTLVADETHDGTLIVSGGTVNIDGIVTGDLIAFCERLSIRGEIQGNVFAISESVEVAGVVAGSAHLGSDRAEISGRIDGDLYVGAENFEISREGQVARDTLVWVADGVIEGSVGRDLYTVGRQMEVRGRIGRTIHARRIRLAIRDGAWVGGNVEASLRPGVEVDVAPGAQIAGETLTEELPSHRRMLMARYGEAAFYVLLALQFVAAFLLGMLLHTVAPRLFDGRLETTGDFLRSMGVGFLGLLVTPFALLLTAITLIGLPIALMGFAVYFAAIYVSTILVAALIGSAIVGPDHSDAHRFGLALLAGLAVVMVLAHLPFVGWPVHIVVLLAGLGLLIERTRNAWNERQLAA
jgi:cytoskeletal protein CcmA (bactofilin family)